MILETSRLILGPFREEDIERFTELMANRDFNADYWNRGLASEAAQAVRAHSFHDLTLAKVISLIYPDNVLSRRIAEKNGMKI